MYIPVNGNNSENERTSISMTLQPSSPAFHFIDTLQNRSGFMRIVLEDFLKKNENPRNYPGLPEKERMEKYFNVKRPRSEIREEILASVAQMRSGEEIKRLCYELEYVDLLQQCGEIFIKKILQDCYFVQFVVLNAKKLAKNGVPYQGVKHAFFSDLENFRESCSSNHPDADWIRRIEEQETSISEAERLFALLANHWYSIADILPGAETKSLEWVTGSVLDYMGENPDAAYMDSAFAATSFTNFVKRKLRTEVKPTPAA